MERNYTLNKGVTMTLTQNSILDEILEKANRDADHAITNGWDVAHMKRHYSGWYDPDYFSLLLARLSFKLAVIATEQAIKDIQISRGY
jgi:hypothetical protein